MSRTPVVTSGDAKVRVASHLSKVPAIATEAFTLNLIVLCGGGEITKKGACACASGGNRAEAANNGRRGVELAVLEFPLSGYDGTRGLRLMIYAFPCPIIPDD